MVMITLQDDEHMSIVVAMPADRDRAPLQTRIHSCAAGASPDALKAK
jgi:hypothetical protein